MSRTDGLLVRPAAMGDLAAITAIYNEQVTGGIATFDTEQVTAASFEPAVLSADPVDVFLVATAADSVLGYAYSGPFRSRPAYASTRETSVYIAPAAHGAGVASALYAELLGRLDGLGVHTQMAVIALPNDASEALHRRHGFTHVGTLRDVGRKFDRWIDTAWYQRVPLRSGAEPP